jgi:hypothetical protein
MLIHLVCFKYKPETPADARANHRAQLAALKELDGVADLKVGEDIVRSPRSYDTGLVAVFRDRAEGQLQRHEPRPEHRAKLVEGAIVQGWNAAYGALSLAFPGRLEVAL